MKFSRMAGVWGGIIGTILALETATVSAGTNGFVIPTFRGQPGTSVAGWERFTAATDNGTGNLPDLVGSTAVARLTQFQPNAIITGSGNLYNQNDPSQFSISYAGGLVSANVVLQLRTAGTELDYSSVKLNYAGGSLTVNRAELDRVAFGVPGTPGSGSFVSSKWEWDLAGKNVKDFNITFSAAEASLSLDSGTLDVRSVPEPATVSLVVAGLALCGLGFWRRR